ncbi:MAG TPA: STAS domain-containing protein [Burkholderiaceae bacterium]
MEKIFMHTKTQSPLASALSDLGPLLDSWLALIAARVQQHGAAAAAQMREHCVYLLPAIAKSVAGNQAFSLDGPGWGEVRTLLSQLSETGARQGYSPTDTANIVFALKDPLFLNLREQLADDPAYLVEQTELTSRLLDQLGLYTMGSYVKVRELLIVNQQRELLELSTPVIKLWDNVLALPLIGTLDSARSQVVMENLLESIVTTGAAIAIIDITGVPTVDTLVAQHLLKTVAAARLLGAECIISGIRPQIAQTIVHLGISLETVATKSTLADAFALALKRTGQTVVSTSH